MIQITEGKPTKIPGETSLYVKLNPIPDVLNIIKQCYPCVYNKNNKLWEIPCTRLSKFVNLASNYDSIKIDLLGDNKKEDKVFELSKNKTKPLKHQIDGIEYGLNHDKFLLLDAPGLGKTLQLIYLSEELKKRENIEHCLIICGINTLKSNWENEIKKHSKLDCITPGKKITKTGKVTYGGIKERLDCLNKKIDEFFVILNIESLRSDEIIKTILKGPNKFDIIAVDEIHCAKSSQSSQGKNLLKLKGAKHKIGMTGTLLLNNPLDVYVPLKFIEADNSTLTNFKSQYVEYGGRFGNEILGYKNVESLQEQIANVSIRRQKDLLDLPEKTVIDEYLDMNPEQENFYNDILNGVIDNVDKVSINTATILSMCTRLRQAASCPSILTTLPIKSTKAQRCLEHVEEIVNSGSKVVVFSQFKKTLNDVLPGLKQYNPLLCTGDVSDDTINENIEKFQNDNRYKVMLCTIQKMGTGVTLNAASYAIFMETSFVYGQQEQHEDRIHRIGTKNPVFIYRLWCNGTFDMRIKQLLDQKKALSDYIIDNKIDDDSKNILKSLLIV